MTDTTIMFDTSFDSGSFEAGIDKVEKRVKELSKQFEKIGDVTAKSTKRAIKEIESMSDKVNKAESKDIGDNVSKELKRGLNEGLDNYSKTFTEKMKGWFNDAFDLEDTSVKMPKVDKQSEPSGDFNTDYTSGLDINIRQLDMQNEKLDEASRKLAKLRSEYEAYSSGSKVPPSLEQTRIQIEKINASKDIEAIKNRELKAQYESLYKSIQAKSAEGVVSKEDLNRLDTLSGRLSQSSARMDELTNKSKSLSKYLNKVKIDPSSSKEAKKLSKDIGTTSNRAEQLSLGISRIKGRIKKSMDGKPVKGLRKDIRDLSKDIDGLSSKTDKQTKSLRGMGRSIVGIAATALAAFKGGELAKEATSMAMQVESSIDNIRFSMGESSQEFSEWAESASQSFGMSTAQAYKYGFVYSNLLSVFTESHEDNAKQTQDLMEATAVIASKTGRTYEDTAERIRSGMLGSTEAIEDLGVYTQISMLESSQAFKELANGQSWAQLDFQTQQQIRLLSILEQAQDRYGNALAETTQTRHAAFTASLGNMKLALGKAFMPIYDVILPALTKMSDAISALLDKMAKFSMALFGNAKRVQGSKMADDSLPSPMASPEQEGFDDFKEQDEVMDEASKSVENYGEQTKKTAKTSEKAMKKMSKNVQGFDQLNKMSDPNEGKTLGDLEPSDMIDPKDIEEVNDAVMLQGERFEAAAEDLTVYEKAIDRIKGALRDFYNKWGLKDFWEGLREGWERINVEQIITDLGRIGSILFRLGKHALGPLSKVSKSLFGALGEVFGGLLAVGGKVTEILVGGLADFLEKDADAIEDAMDRIGNSISSGLDDWGEINSVIFDSIFKGFEDHEERLKKVVSDTFSNAFRTIVFPVDVIADIFAGVSGNIKEFVVENEVRIDQFFSNFIGVFTDIGERLNTVWGDVLTIVEDMWDEYGEHLIELISGIITEALDSVLTIFNETFMPVWDTLMEEFDKLWEKVTPILEDIGEIFGEIMVILEHLWSEYLGPLVNYIIGKAAPLIGKVLSSAVSTVGRVFGIIGDTLGGLIRTLKGVIKFISGVFTGDWKKAFEGVKDMTSGIMKAVVSVIKAPVNAIISMFEKLVNFVIKAFNKMGEFINKFGFDVPDWVPLLGGKEFRIDFPTVPEVKLGRVKMPKLAKGGLIPPRKPRPVIVGDNMVEDEIVSPVSTMQKALADVLVSTGGGGMSNEETNNLLRTLISEIKKGQTIVMNGRELGRAVHDIANNERKRTGRSYI